jgi:hypothetical protein
MNDLLESIRALAAQYRSLSLDMANNEWEEGRCSAFSTVAETLEELVTENRGCHMSAKLTIVRNAIKCRKCGDVIESTHRHDFRHCSCETVFVDGGHDYLRRCGDLASIEDQSILVCPHGVEWGDGKGYCAPCDADGGW